MSTESTLLLLGIVVAAGTAAAVSALLISRAPVRLIYENVRGRRVPAVLGSAAVIGLLAAGCLTWTLGLPDPEHHLGHSPVAAYALVVGVAVAMGLVGLYDDLRGEADRGFRGHLSALRSGRVTAGLAKILVGGLAGLACADVLLAYRLDDGAIPGLLAIGTVPLAANACNLLDRAPGRAGKLFLPALIIAATFSAAAWRLPLLVAGAAFLTTWPFDLRERGMLGDAGSNPLGALIGLAVVTGAPVPLAVVFLILLVLLNVAAERVSFSEIIDRTPFLRALDRAGRPRE